MNIQPPARPDAGAGNGTLPRIARIEHRFKSLSKTQRHQPLPHSIRSSFFLPWAQAMLKFERFTAETLRHQEIIANTFFNLCASVPRLDEVCYLCGRTISGVHSIGFRARRVPSLQRRAGTGVRNSTRHGFRHGTPHRSAGRDIATSPTSRARREAGRHPVRGQARQAVSRTLFRQAVSAWGSATVRAAAPSHRLYHTLYQQPAGKSGPRPSEAPRAGRIAPARSRCRPKPRRSPGREYPAPLERHAPVLIADQRQQHRAGRNHRQVSMRLFGCR